MALLSSKKTEKIGRKNGKTNLGKQIWSLLNWSENWRPSFENIFAQTLGKSVLSWYRNNESDLKRNLRGEVHGQFCLG